MIVASATAAAVIFATGCFLVRHAPAFWLLCAGFTLVGGMQVISTLQVCLSQARGQYLHTTIAPLIVSTGLLAGVLVAIHERKELYLLLGQLAGTTLAIWAMNKLQRVRLKASVRRDSVIGRAVFAPLRSHIVAIAFGTTAFTLFQPIDAALCAHLDSGSMAIMAFSQRVMVAFGTVVSLGAHVIAARTSRDTLREGGHVALRRQANIESLRVIVLGFCAWLAYEIGGKNVLMTLLSSSAMSRIDVSRLVLTVGWMLLGVGPMAVMPYLFRIFFSVEDYRKPAILGISIAPAYGLVGATLLHHYKILALASSYMIVWWIGVIVALVWINRSLAVGSRQFAYATQTLRL